MLHSISNLIRSERTSGVMTFIVDESGTIYEKDLGPDTTKLAQAMTVYDPDSTWHEVE